MPKADSLKGTRERAVAYGELCKLLASEHAELFPGVEWAGPEYTIFLMVAQIKVLSDARRAGK